MLIKDKEIKTFDIITDPEWFPPTFYALMLAFDAGKNRKDLSNLV